MRIRNLMLKALCAVALVASVSVSCSEIDFIEIDAPADLQHKIDSVQHVKDSLAALLGDKTMIDISVAEVGASDYTSGWWVDFSQYFEVPQGKCLTIKFINHNGGSVNNWNNWNLCVATGERDSDGYSEFFVLRSDAYGWGNGDYNSAMIGQDYPDTDGDGDIWNDFRKHLDGAEVEMMIDYAAAGTVFVTAVHTSADGLVLTETYEQPVTGTSVTAFLIADASFMEVKEAYTEPSKILEIPDEMAASIVVTGTPSALELGNTDFWGEAVATVTFADGATAVADTADITFVVPDLSTVGEKTIIYSYSKTKQGNYGTAVAGTYKLNVINPVKSLEVTSAPSYSKYYVFDAPVAFDPTGLVVTATYADETTGVLDNSMLTFGQVPADGSQEVEISYVGTSSTVTVKCPVEVVKGTAAVGSADCTTGFFTALLPDVQVPAGESVSFNVYHYSACLNNWSCLFAVLRNAALAENAVVRLDHFGWGAGYDNNPNLLAESNWNWDTYLQGLNRADIKVTVTNNGDNTADIRMDVTYLNGETHFQSYKGITVDSADLQITLGCENAYLVIY